ncbi:MAG: hypothetical protein H0T84_02200 [Tatlockia sp.]|nr:hypothetical protein [Tatlockia sp.]
MDWYEFKQLIDLTSKVFFAKNKSSHDDLWKQYEAAVLYACGHYPYNLTSENVDDTSHTIAKKLYKSWIQFNYSKHPGKQFQAAVGHSINCTFGTTFCLENIVFSLKNKQDKMINHPKKTNAFFTEQKPKSNSSDDPKNKLNIPSHPKENISKSISISKGQDSFFKIKEVNDLGVNIYGKRLNFTANP